MTINRNIKQVIVMRADLGMRKGKMIAQGAHASVAFMREMILYETKPTKVQKIWMEEGQTKICVRVDSEEELIQIYHQALHSNLEAHLITDAGLTEFDGPTKTCCSIGPDYAEKIDKITGKLKLL